MIQLYSSFLLRDFRIDASYRFSFLMNVVGIFFSAFTFYFISELFGIGAAPYLAQYDVDYFSFVIIGIAFSGYFGLGLSGFARSIREAQTTGTMEALLMTPTPLSIIITGSALWSYTLTTFRVLIYLLVGTLLFTLNLDGANYLGALISLLLSIFVFASIGISAAGIIMVIKRGEAITTLIAAIANLLGGIYYPIEILPEWLQFFSKLVPVTYAVRAMRLALLKDASMSELMPDIVALLVFLILFAPLSLIVFRHSVARARHDGSLAHY